ncbi:MAG: chemotaxis protein CheA [Aureliella sp.]
MDDKELLAEFVVESQEHLAEVENQLLTLESQGDQVDVDLVNTVFRAVHSVKGAAGFLGLEVLGGVAHLEEEVLNRLRNQEMQPTPQVIDTLLKATDCLKGLLDDVESSNEEDVDEHLHALRCVLNGDEPSADKEQSKTLASPAKNVQEETLREFLIESFDNVEQLERDLLALEETPDSVELVNGAFRSIHSIKGAAGYLGFCKLERLTHAIENILSDVRDGVMELRPELQGAFFQCIDKLRQLLSSIEAEGCDEACDSDLLADAVAKLHDILLPPSANRPAKAVSTSQSSLVTASKAPEIPDAKPAKTTAAESSPDAGKTTPPTKPAAKATKPQGDVSAADSTIRVDVSLLDQLMTSVGELVLTRNQILQATAGQPESDLYRTSQRLNLITSELQENVMKTRMQPIGNVWSKFPRLVRDLGTACQKQVRVEMQGKETELDKTIIEAIKDPLTHLVRNTVDHGIEAPDRRTEIGKPAEGTLLLKAFHEGGQVNIEIIDDGNGIDPEKIRNKAVEKGLLSQEKADAMASRDAANLIFLPGFSTAESISSVSGRGVGMDVVKTNIEKIGGTVELQSELGAGTTFKIKIPLTLAIIPALIVKCAGDRYAIPQVNLLELVRLDRRQAQAGIEWIKNTPVYRLRGKILPLVYLRDQLSIDRDDSDDLNIIVLRADGKQFGLVVDKTIDTEEIVVKPPDEHIKSISVYSGMTIMGDGQVALIIDVIGLAKSAGLSGEDLVPENSVDGICSSEQMTDTESLLITQIGSEHRFAIRSSQITRLEQIDSSDLEWSQGRRVVQYRDDTLSLQSLAESVGIETGATDFAGQLNVLVIATDGGMMGVVVDDILDIVECKTQDAAEGSLAATRTEVINQHLTDIIDLRAIYDN